MNYLEKYKSELSAIKSELNSRFKVKSIGLYGSIVRDDFKPNSSDIDIIVDFSALVGIEFIDLGNFLENTLHRKVDLVSRSGIKPEYLKEIESEIIYV